MADGKKKESKDHQPAEAKSAYVALLATADRIRSFFESVCAPFNITAQQYNVLRILRGAGPEGLPTLTIAERMIERAPGITRMIDRLESKGLVEREVCPSDRRCVYCRITRKGLDLLKQLDGPVKEANRAAFGGLSKAEIEQLTALLLKARKAHESKGEQKG
ncbi:MAG TPA: MarR family transcriptional regulator [Blastocatellia bacterium]|nr:MarR family transcriptional regulator [Blastocatellia bacterium]